MEKILKLPDPFLQKHYEEFNLKLRKMTNDPDIPLAVYRGDIVRVAAECGWLEGITKKDVSEMVAVEVGKISAEIQELLASIANPEKN